MKSMRLSVLSALVLGLAFSANAEEVIVEENAYNTFDVVSFGGGFGGNFVNKSNGDYNRVLGTLLMGITKEHNRFVFGAEVAYDFAKPETKTGDYVDLVNRFAGDATIKFRGGTPRLAVKFGYDFGKGMLAYAKVGTAFHKLEMNFALRDDAGRDYDKPFNKTKASLVLGAGFERAFCNKVSAAVEAEYDFGANYNVYDEECKIDMSGKAFKGFNIRALVKYNIKY